jgi:S1-C subfamily serine protease
MSTGKLIATVAIVTGLMGGGAATLVAAATAERPQGDPPQPPELTPPPQQPPSEKEIARQAAPSVVRLVGQTQDGQVSGTGFVIDAEEGIVVTNAHVVAGTTSLRATAAGQELGTARILGQATCEDVAVVQLDATEDLVEIPFGDSDALEPMDTVVALGYPTSLEAEPTLSSTAGQISKTESAVNQDGVVDGTLPAYNSALEHTALIDHGSSGGPLVNQDGEVVGINTLKDGGKGWAISSDHVQPIVERLVEGDSPAYLGWSAAPIPEFVASSEDPSLFQQLYDVEGGLILTGVEPGSPAEAAGLEAGDLVFELGGQTVDTMADVCAVTGGHSPGAEVSVTASLIDVDDQDRPYWSDLQSATLELG